MQTTLNLLTRDGAFYMAFAPSLTAVHYAELLELVLPLATQAEMLAAVQQWARARGLRVSFDEAREP